MSKYSDPKTGLSGSYATYKRNEGRVKDIKNNLIEQTGYQLNFQNRSRRNYFPIVGKGPGSWQIDLMFFKPPWKGIENILCCVNVNTRYAYCYCFKNKSDTYIYVKKFLEDAKKDERPVNFIQSDNGTEFLNKKVSPIIKQFGVEHETVNPADHTGQGIVERFNGTLRRLIILYINSNDNNNWVSVFDDLVYNYNHRYHSSLGTSPINMNELIAVNMKREQWEKAQKDYDKIKIGDQVRLLKNRDIFDKGRLLWSTKVYNVIGKEGHLVQLNDGNYYTHYQVQVIKGGGDAGEEHEKAQKQYKKEKKIIRALAKEGILETGDRVEIKPRGKREKKVEDYIGRTYRRKYGRKYYEGRVIEYEGDDGGREVPTWIVEYPENIKDKNILDGRFERVSKNELEIYSKK